MHHDSRPCAEALLAFDESPRFLVLYEKAKDAAQALHFSKQLAAKLEHDALPCLNALWRLDLLDFATIASEAAAAASKCQYLVLGLQGDRELSYATKVWLEGWVREVKSESALIALFDPRSSNARVATGTRHYLRSITSGTPVSLFSHSIVHSDVDKSPKTPTLAESVNTINPAEWLIGAVSTFRQNCQSKALGHV